MTLCLHIYFGYHQTVLPSQYNISSNFVHVCDNVNGRVLSMEVLRRCNYWNKFADDPGGKDFCP